MNQLGNCIHYKDGKYRLWSSYTDTFITDWESKGEIESYLRVDALTRFDFEVEQRFKRAEKNGCSLIPELIRHGGDSL